MKTTFFNKSFIHLTILIANIYLYNSSYLPSGLNQFNHFIYLERLKDLTFQTYSKECSLNKGPNCYFTENILNEKYEKELNNNNNKNNDYLKNDKTILDFHKQWMDIYSQSLKAGYLNTFTELNDYIISYKDYISSRTDSSQIPQPITLRLSLTFESYDDMTKKGDMYAYDSKPVHFLTETVYIEFVGKLRLTYGEESKEKESKGLPTKTYGIIESNNLVIKLGGKKFICESFFMRLRDEVIKSITVEGYTGNTRTFSANTEINFMHKSGWFKINLPGSKVDRIVLPGGIDVDNFKFLIETTKQYDISVQFHTSYTKNVEELIHDDDI